MAYKWFPRSIRLGMSENKLEEIQEIPMIFLIVAFITCTMNGNRTLMKTNHLLGSTLLRELRSVKVGEKCLPNELQEQLDQCDKYHIIFGYLYFL